MYTGRSQSFKLGGESFTLSRPAYAQMAGFAELVEDGKVIEPLLEAVDNREKFEATLKTADHEAVGKLFDDFCEFAAVNHFLVETLRRINARNETIMKALETESEALMSSTNGRSQLTGEVSAS